MLDKLLSLFKSNRKPSRFFMKCHDDGIPPSRVQEIVSQYGKDVLIGVDPGLKDTPVEESQATIDEVKAQGALFHMYLVGPGSFEWSTDEANQIKFLAKSIGINTRKNDWKRVWKAGGWEKKIYQQFSYYNKMGAYSCEIDNLDQIWDQDPDKAVEFFVRLQDYKKNNKISSKLGLKNLNEEQLKKVKENVDNGVLSVDMFAEFGMFEKGSGDEDQQIAICESLGIKAVTPKTGLTDTYHYGTINDGVAALI